MTLKREYEASSTEAVDMYWDVEEGKWETLPPGENFRNEKVY